MFRREFLLQHLQRFAERVERACAENSSWLYALDVDPSFDTLRAKPEFRRR